MTTSETLDQAGYALDPFREYFWRTGYRVVAERNAYSVYRPPATLRPTVIELESLAAGAADYSKAAETRWCKYAGDFSNGAAVLTKASGVQLRTSIPQFSPGDYEVDLAFYNYDAAVNTVVLQIGDVERELRIGPGEPPGFHRLTNVRFDDVQSPTVCIRSGSVGQSYLLLDTMVIRRSSNDWPAGERLSTLHVGEPRVHPQMLEGEKMRAVSGAVDYGTAAGAGWASYESPLYSGGRAALTKLPGAEMHGALQPFHAGTYRVSVRGYSYGNGWNELEIALGSTRHRIRMGGPAGLVRVDGLLVRDVTSPRVAVRALSIPQPYLVIDALEIEWIAPSGTPQH